MFTVIYDDPKRKRGATHTVHSDGCRDIARSVSRGGNPHQLVSEDLNTALIEARYGGHLEPVEGADLGDVDPAPCALILGGDR